MKKKIIALMCCAAITFGVGLSIAYYNTKTFGFDENTKVITYDDEKITFMDYSVYYDDVTEFVEKVGTVIPKKSRTVVAYTHYDVAYI